MTKIDEGNVRNSRFYIRQPFYPCAPHLTAILPLHPTSNSHSTSVSHICMHLYPRRRNVWLSEWQRNCHILYPSYGGTQKKKRRTLTTFRCHCVCRSVRVCCHQRPGTQQQAGRHRHCRSVACILLFLGWRGGSIARASHSRAKDPRFEPRHKEHKKNW